MADEKLEEAAEATEWALRKLKKARANKTPSRQPTADEPFPSVSVIKTGAWIKKQHTRMKAELAKEIGIHNRWQDTYRTTSGYSARHDMIRRDQMRQSNNLFHDWADRMKSLLEHVELLASHAEDDDEFTFSLAEVKTLSTSMKRNA